MRSFLSGYGFGCNTEPTALLWFTSSQGGSTEPTTGSLPYVTQNATPTTLSFIFQTSAALFVGIFTPSESTTFFDSRPKFWAAHGKMPFSQCTKTTILRIVTKNDYPMVLVSRPDNQRAFVTN